jgi:N6-adenosine-specific RNA methylase IME4
VCELHLHRRAGLVPAMTEPEHRDFLADVARRGIVEPLQITEAGVVLDGRHRLQAAQELGIARVPVRVVAPSDEVEHMLLAAISRRQLTPSQRACIAVDLDCYKRDRDEAARRQRQNLRQNVTEVATLPTRTRSRDVAARAGSVSGRLVQDAIAIRDGDRELFERVKRGELPLNRARRELQQARRYASIGAAPALPSGRFELIYADPPWQLGNPDSDYAPEQYYPTLRLAEIAALDVPAAADALLYLWAVNSHLPEALHVMAAWGFEYRGCEVWVKQSIGMGVWTRYRHEQLLIGRKGNASPAPRRKLLDSVIEAPRGRHSEKPICVYERLEHLYPDKSKLELFARGKQRGGWTMWGNESEQAA